MAVRVVRVLAVAALCAPWLAGCESWKAPAWLSKQAEPAVEAAPPPVVVSTPEITGTVDPPVQAQPGVTPELRGDLDSDLNLGKRHFREGEFGLAEKHFRRAVEKGLPDARDAAEAWLGLAASYDRLRRFELADRAYARAIAIVGPAPEILNNQGYSYLMRGDYAHARVKLNEARAKDPANPHILANLDLLDRAVRPR
jgi:tetratricopeptide (TPR) repeat protein